MPPHQTKPQTPEDKLAAALRANLLKRKQQATERAATKQAQKD